MILEDWIIFILCCIGMILSLLMLSIEGAKLLDETIKELRR